MNPRSIIITSGTLNPFSELESEINMTFPMKLVGDSGTYLNLSHMNLTKNATKVSEDTGRAIVSIIQQVKSGGVLVFFQSYDKMTKLIKDWD